MDGKRSGGDGVLGIPWGRNDRHAFCINSLPKGPRDSTLDTFVGGDECE